MNWHVYINRCKQWYQYKKQQRAVLETDIVTFFRQFATLITAGIPIIKACTILEKSQEKIALRLLIYSMKRDMLAGRQLAHSMRQHPIHFNELLCQLIHLGEQTGKLDTILILIADAQEKKLAVKRRIKQALFYPSIILITAILLMLCMLLFVIPRFAELFANVKDLPLLTSCIFYLSAQLRRFGWLIGMGLIPTVLFAQYVAKFNIFSIIRQAAFTRLPILRQYLHKVLLAHFTRNMSIAFAAGIPILDALQLSSHGHANANFDNAMMSLKTRISSGESMHQAMTNHLYFSTYMVQMIKIGEESGKLDSMLAKTADYLEAEIEQITARLGQTLEPLIMIVLGVLIGGLVVSMYLPIFKLGSLL